MQGRAHRGRGRATGLLLAALVAGCAAEPPPPGLGVRIEQSRDNENRHLLQVVLTNDGPEPVDVVHLQLRAPGFVDVPPTVRSDVVRTGQRTAFPVAYGAADCGERGATRVLLGYRAGGELREAELAVPPDDPLLPRLHARECALAELARTARIAFAPGWRREGDAAVGELVVRRRSGREPVTLTSLEGTVVFTLRTHTPLPVRLEQREVTVAVRVTASRCDAHALIESKRSYDFPWYAALGPAEPLYGTARPDAAGRAVLEELLLDTCRPAA